MSPQAAATASAPSRVPFVSAGKKTTADRARYTFQVDDKTRQVMRVNEDTLAKDPTGIYRFPEPKEGDKSRSLAEQQQQVAYTALMRARDAARPGPDGKPATPESIVNAALENFKERAKGSPDLQKNSAAITNYIRRIGANAKTSEAFDALMNFMGGTAPQQ
jgi:hypothetical protein